MRRARELSAVPICALCWLHPGTALWRASGVWRLADEGCQPSTAEARARSSRCGAKHGHRSTFGSAPRTRHAVVCRGGPQPRACPCECDCRLVRSASSNFLGMHRAHTTQSSAGSAAVSSLARVVWCPCRREGRGARCVCRLECEQRSRARAKHGPAAPTRTTVSLETATPRRAAAGPDSGPFWRCASFGVGRCTSGPSRTGSRQVSEVLRCGDERCAKTQQRANCPKAQRPKPKLRRGNRTRNER